MVDETEEIVEEEGTPAIFLRQVDVVIQNEGEEPIVIEAPKQEKEEEDATQEGEE